MIFTYEQLQSVAQIARFTLDGAINITRPVNLPVRHYRVRYRNHHGLPVDLVMDRSGNLERRQP